MYQEKLDLLMNKYGVSANAVMESPLSVTVDGKAFPLLPHRYERRFIELKKMLHDGTVTGISAIRCGHVAAAGTDLNALIRRELDLCQFLSGQKIVTVSAFMQQDKAVMILAVLESGIVCPVELAVTLPAGSQPIDKHEVISARGLVCDRVVDTQIPQQSVYLYADTNEAYTDVDFELYGLSVSDVAAVRNAFALVKDPALRTASEEISRTLDHLTECVRQSALTGHKVNV